MEEPSGVGQRRMDSLTLQMWEVWKGQSSQRLHFTPPPIHSAMLMFG